MLELRDLAKSFGQGGEQTVAVNKINLRVKKGEFVVLIGPSGCGKTTTLKMINRLVEPTSGDIRINGKSTNNVNQVKLRRDIGYVIQSIGLFPHLTIAANVEIVPRLKKWNIDKKKARTCELLSMVGLDPEIYADRYPSELSGGEQQRIGVLRALATEPDLILMDEPFGALDPITRDQLQIEIKELQQKLQKTIVFVTHDMEEALSLADTIVLMKEGKIVQQASPREMLTNPANDFVREFIGESRLMQQPDTTSISKIMVPKPLIVKQTDSLHVVLQAMQKSKSDFAVVTDEKKRAVGIVEARSIRVALKNKATQLSDLLDDLEDVTVHRYTTIRDAALSLANGIRILCVVDEQNRPLGLINRPILLRGLVDIWDEHESA